jgi:hypothetical protein
MAGALLALAVGAGGALLLRPRSLEVTVAGEPAQPGGWIAAPGESPVPVLFSDGTHVRLASGGHARIVEVTSHGAHLMLESGSASLEVVPRPHARWTVSAGPYVVEVKGTRFEIAWSPQEERLTLVLTEGRVVVSGCALGDQRPLLAGETLRASCREGNFQITRSAAEMAAGSTQRVAASPAEGTSVHASPVPAAPGDPASVPAHPGASRPSLAVSGGWQALARASKFKEAFDVAKDLGFDGEVERASAPDLLLLGDAARFSGNPGYALRAYEKARARAPGTPSAANAAFAMGRVYFDQLDSFADAAQWFATYSSEQRDGPLAREALGRRMEALARAGDRAAAARAAEQYLRQYPGGPHAPLARTLVAEGK